MNSSAKRTIRKEIFRSSIILSSIILLIFGLFLSYILYHSGMSKAQQIIKQRNHAVSFFIDGYFSEINNTIEILAADEEVQNAPFLGAPEKQRIKNLYRSFTKVNQNISFIYSGYKNKELLIDDYIPPEGFDPTTRPWYKSAMSTKPLLSTGLPYHEIKSKEWLLSTSKALQSASKEYTGVVSSDSSIEVITNQLEQRGDIYKSSYSFVTQPSGEVILHHNKDYLKRNILEVIGKDFDLNKNEGLISYKLDNKEKFAYYTHCNEADWIVFTVVEKSEIVKSIIYQILIYILLTGTIAVLLGFSQSIVLSRRFSTPLLQLQKKVQAIIHGNWENDSSYTYPNNEIGIISKEIGQLTANEIYARSKQLQESNALLEQKNEELNRLSTTDQLTGLYNRHKIDIELENECQRSTRYGKNFSVILFDIDWFKHINDTHGHLAGDSVLKDIALLMKNELRSIDIAGRWGGEEFIIICPETDIKEAQTLGERVCSLVANHQFTIKESVTISVGVTQFSGQENPENLIKRVDDNLYEAKHKGKNTVVAL